MPIPSDSRPEAEQSDRAAHRGGPRRSVFGNYAPPQPGGGGAEQAQTADPELGPAQARQGATRVRGAQAGLQSAIDTAVARAFLHQFLARAFDDPAAETWVWLTDAGSHSALRSAVRALADRPVNLESSAAFLAARLQPGGFERYRIAYVVAFGHAARGDCPLNEIEYGDLKADPLFQPHRLADLAAFYRAFGLEVADGAAERPDHLGMELEFMSVLAAKEAYALEHQFDGEHLALCRDAQRKFLREHLGRWACAFARRLARAATDEALPALAEFLRAFIAAECARFEVKPGDEDLVLRPVEEAAESLCASCGLHTSPPGAAAPGTTT